MSNIDRLIVSTEKEIEAAKERLALLKSMKAKEDESSYVSTDEAADMLGVTRATVVTWLTEGRLNGRKPGRKWQVSLASVKEGGRTNPS